MVRCGNGILKIIYSEFSPISSPFLFLFVVIMCMTSQHKRTFCNSLFSCFLLPTLRTKFPHFLCTVCKIVVCSQHSFHFKEFNSQSAAAVAADLHPSSPTKHENDYTAWQKIMLPIYKV